MPKNKLKVTLLASLVLLTTACNTAFGILPSIGSATDVASSITRLASFSRQRVKVVFLNQLPNAEQVPLVPTDLEQLIFDGQFSLSGSSFEADKGLEQTFPFIEAGEHVIELFFKDQEGIQIPLIVSKTVKEETVILVVLSFEAGSTRIRDIQVGYDQNQDQQIDRDQSRYRSSNGVNYLLYRPDGRTQEWLLPGQRTSDGVSAEGEAPLPPGAVQSQPIQDRAPQPQDKTASPAPSVDVPQIPIPKPIPLPVPVN